MQQTFYYEREGGVYKNINNSRLIGIDIYYKNEESKLIKSYDLTYNQNNPIAGEYFLEAVALTNYNVVTGESASIKPTTFDWNFYYPKRLRIP